MATIGKRIQHRREELGMTQEELAHKVGLQSKSAIQKIEKGINDIKQSRIKQFAEALDTTTAYLMDSDPPDEIDQEILQELQAMPSSEKRKILEYIRFVKAQLEKIGM